MYHRNGMSTCGGSNDFELYGVYMGLPMFREQAEGSEPAGEIYGISIDPFQPSKSQDVVHSRALGFVQLMFFYGLGSHGMKITIFHHHFRENVIGTSSKHRKVANPSVLSLFFVPPKNCLVHKRV